MVEGKIIQPQQPQQGTWGNLPTTDVERKPKVDFEINISHVCEFLQDTPTEAPSEAGGVYYIFAVKEDNVEKVIMTSAWSMLRGLKVNAPLKGKKLKITKRLVKGKQQFEVVA